MKREPERWTIEDYNREIRGKTVPIRKPSGTKKDYPGIVYEQLKVCGAPLPIREFIFHPVRRWRFDLAWPERKLALEVDGVVYHEAGKGRHQTVSGVEQDCNKFNEALLLNWRILRVTQAQVKSGEALAFIERALKLFDKI